MNQISTSRIVAYGTGAVSKDLIGGMIGAYLLIFYTDVFGITAVAAGMIMMGVRIWDAINDPMMGALADKTRTRFGRYRLYILIAPFFIALFAWLTFTTPGFESYAAKVAWAAITYTLLSMSFTAFDVPMWSLVPAISSDPHVRNKLIVSQRIFTFASVALAMTVAYPLIKYFGGGTELVNTQLGYSRLLLLFGALGILAGMLVFFTQKENIKAPDETPSLKQMFGILKQNKHAQYLIVISFFLFLPINISSGVKVFFVTYNIGRPDLVPTLMMPLALSPLPGMVIAASIAKKFGRHRTSLVALSIATVANAILCLAGQNLYVFVPLVILSGIMTGILSVLLVGMIADTTDYTQWKSGARIDGVIFSLNSFVYKLAMAVGVGSVGFLLDWFGYVPASSTQSAFTILGIQILQFGLPMIPLIIGAILLSRYKLDDATMEECRAHLDHVRATSEST